jgi:hypothetical protein
MDKKNRFRAGLSFGIGIMIFFIVRNVLIGGEDQGQQIIKTVVAVFVAGTLAGVFFGWLTGLFDRSRLVSPMTKVLSEPGEKILYESPANHFKSREGIGGKLYLTNKRLVFKSHSFNLEKHQLSISLSDIKQVDNYTRSELVNNGLSVTTKDGRTERFVVKEVQDWVKHLVHRNGLRVENR